ncbi:hypothetical protein D1872_289850 [compost metagenome]
MFAGVEGFSVGFRHPVQPAVLGIEQMIDEKSVGVLRMLAPFRFARHAICGRKGP